MNNQFIQRVIFDWDKIDKDSIIKLKFRGKVQ